MQALQSRLSLQGLTSNFSVFKEPRGIIRVLQIIFAILAFSTAVNGRSSMSLHRGNEQDLIVSSWSYPYKLGNAGIRFKNGTTINTLSSSSDPKPTAEFFVFTAVTAMLLAIGFAAVYVVMDEVYRSNPLYPTCDFASTLLWTIFWIAGSSAWAQGVTNIRSETGWDNIRQRTGLCPTAQACPDGSAGNYANIIVSVLFGYLNFILWAGCAWFVFKETTFFKLRHDPTPQMQQNNFDDVSAPPMSTQSYMQSPISMR